MGLIGLSGVADAAIPIAGTILTANGKAIEGLRHQPEAGGRWPILAHGVHGAAPKRLGCFEK